MTIQGVRGLLGDLEFSFVLPSVSFVMFVINRKWSRSTSYDRLLLRLGLFFSLLLFLTSFTVLMYQDRTVLYALWQSSPLLYSVVYGGSAILIASALTWIVHSKLRPSLWTLRNPVPYA